MNVLDQIKKAIKKWSIDAVPFDPAKFDDELANRVSWGPAKSGGASFKTHRLVIDEPFLAQFKTTIGHLVFGAIFLLVGLGLVVIYFNPTLGGLIPKESGSGASWVPIVVGVVFTIVGGGILYSALSPISFDKREGVFRKGRKAADVMAHAETDLTSGVVQLSEVHAIQLIAERCRSKDSSYMSYELNLVLATGKRVNVVDHGGHHQIREDAKRLGDFLDVPVWDAT